MESKKLFFNDKKIRRVVHEESNIQYTNYELSDKTIVNICFSDGITYLGNSFQNYELVEPAVDFSLTGVDEYDEASLLKCIEEYKVKNKKSKEPLEISLSFMVSRGEESNCNNVYFHEMNDTISQDNNSESLDYLIEFSNQRYSNNEIADGKDFSIVIMIGSCQDSNGEKIPSHASVLIIDHKNNILYSFDSGGIHQKQEVIGNDNHPIEVPLEAVYGKNAINVRLLNPRGFILQNSWSCTFFATEFAKVIDNVTCIIDIVMEDEIGNIILRPYILEETLNNIKEIESGLINNVNCTEFLAELKESIILNEKSPEEVEAESAFLKALEKENHETIVRQSLSVFSERKAKNKKTIQAKGARFNQALKSSSSDEQLTPTPKPSEKIKQPLKSNSQPPPPQNPPKPKKQRRNTI